MRTLCSAHCIRSAQLAVFTVQAQHTVQYTLCSIHCAHCAANTVQTRINLASARAQALDSFGTGSEIRIGLLFVGKSGRNLFLTKTVQIIHRSTRNLKPFHLIPHMMYFYHLGYGFIWWCILFQKLTFCRHFFSIHCPLFHPLKSATYPVFTQATTFFTNILLIEVSLHLYKRVRTSLNQSVRWSVRRWC